MTETYICKRPVPAREGSNRVEKRIPIHVFAINDERVLYEYKLKDDWVVGCISRKLFDNDYEKI